MRRLLYMTVAAVAAACTGGAASGGILHDAFDDFESGKYAESEARLAAIVADSTTFAALPLPVLCDMARLSVRLDSAMDSETNDAVAARCLSRARDIDPDSVDAFIESLPAEQADQLRLLNSVSTYLTMPRDSLVTDSDTVQ